MSRILDQIDNPEQLRAVPESELPKVAREIREFLIDGILNPKLITLEEITHRMPSRHFGVEVTLSPSDRESRSMAMIC